MSESPRPKRPRVIVTRQLMPSVEGRMAELFDVALSAQDQAFTQQELRKQREQELKRKQDFRTAQQRDVRNHQNDWRRDARYNNFRAPFAYQRFQAGSKLNSSYYSRNYRQTWDNRWGLPRAKKNEAYVRHYNDLLLVNERNGKVVRVYRDHFRYR